MQHIRGVALIVSCVHIAAVELTVRLDTFGRYDSLSAHCSPELGKYRSGDHVVPPEDDAETPRLAAIRSAIQPSTSSEGHALALAPSEIGRGNAPSWQSR